MKRKNTRHGFTIVELVIVIAVIAILASVLVPVFGNVIQNAKDSAAKQEAKNAYTQYLVDSKGATVEYMVYEADGRFVALHNGAAVDVFDSKDDALKAMVANGDPTKLNETAQGSGMWIYGEVPSIDNGGEDDGNQDMPTQPSEKPEVSYAGKKLSILGDSISTYEGVSNNTTFNTTLGNNEVYRQYNDTSLGSQQYTWWQQVIDTLGMSLCVNNSWSGSCILQTRSGANGAYLDRCVQLHNDNTGEEPDVIVVFMGTNDFSYYQSTLGSADSINYSTLIIAQNDGTFTYATPTTSCEAYAIMIHKMTQRYPDAEIICMSLLSRRAEDYTGDSVEDPGIQPTAFNAELAKIATRFGCTVVNLENCGITPELSVFDHYILDSRVHPNALGMDMISAAVIDCMTATNDVHTVKWNMSNVTINNKNCMVNDGDAFSVKLTAKTYYGISTVKVTMGGSDITAECYQNGEINIPSVNGDVVIQVTTVSDLKSYRWEFEGDTVTSVTTNGNTANTLTLQDGSITDGILNGAYFQMATDVVLRHDCEWVVEWSAAGNWTGMILSQMKVYNDDGNIYFLKNANQLVVIGNRTNNLYENYGFDLDDYAIDTTQRHIYRMENRIAADGSNTIYLWIDGVELGAMNGHYHGSNTQNSTENWANGRDFVFSYVGAQYNALTNCDLDYLQIYEGGIN